MALGTKRKATQRLSVNPVSLPSGAVQEFAGSTAPEGWLMCDGSAVSRTDYAALFSVIGDTYGVGDGSTTFNLPDLRGEFVRGLDDMGTAQGARGVDSGRGLGSTQTDTTAPNGMSASTSASSQGAGNHQHFTLRSGRVSAQNTVGNNEYVMAEYVQSSGSANYIKVGTSSVANVGLTSTPTNGTTHTHPISASTSLSGDTETRPRNCAMNFIIKL